MTLKAEAALTAHVKANPEVSTVDLVKLAKQQQGQAVPAIFIEKWKSNKRSRLAIQRQSLPKFAWTRADWEQLERTLGRVDYNEKADAPNKLQVADASFTEAATTVVLVNPFVFQQVLEMLTNKKYIKLSGDGTHKLTHDEWAFITLGVLTKHYSSDGRVYAFRSTYTPLAYAISNTESKPAYDLLFAVAIRMAESLCGLDFSQCVKQYHADLHPGEEAARRERFPNTARVADFAHVIGATQPKKNNRDNPPIPGFRSGLFSLARKHVSVAGRRLLPLIEHTIHLLRIVPTALVFHSVAVLLFDTLLAQVPPERTLAQKLQTHHFTKVLAREARKQFKLESWTGEGGYIWLAPWWCGLQRVQPGSASGTQPQESWHRHKLKKFLGSIRMSIPALAENLQQFTESTLEQLRLQGPCLPDVPTEPFPDKYVLHESNALSADGRTAAIQFVRCNAFSTHSDGESHFYSMRRTEATYNPVSKTWSKTADSAISRAQSVTSQQMAALVSARDDQSFNAAMRAVCSEPQDLKAVVKALASHVVVLMGAAAREFWCFSEVGAASSSHVHAVCAFCLPFALHGTCEHTHVAFVDTKQVDLTEARLPQWGKQRPAPTSHLPDVALVLPGPAVPEAAESSCARASRPRDPASSVSPQLSALLTAADASEYIRLFGIEQLSPADIGALDFVSLRAIFPTVPAKLLLRIQHIAAKARWDTAARNPVV